MYLILMDARTSEVILAKRSNSNPVEHHMAETRALLEEKFPGRPVLSPMQRIPSAPALTDIVLVTVYKSRNKRGEGRLCGPWQTWAVLPASEVHHE